MIILNQAPQFPNHLIISANSDLYDHAPVIKI